MKDGGTMGVGWAAVLWVVGASGLSGQEVARCEPANRFLTERLEMETRIDPDTLDDWRTDRLLPGCRVTAAGGRTVSLRTAARSFYDALRAAGWTRTPNPQDAPNEASLRFRMEDTDCLFNVYQGILLGTDAEIAVTRAAEERSPGALYHVLAICVVAIR